MLVDNKFIIIQIPRCATTSFLHTCQVNNIPAEYINSHGRPNLYNFKIGKGERFHEDIFNLQERFGYEYPVIAIKRDKISSFISLWKQMLKMFLEWNEVDLYNKLAKLTYEDILFFSEDDYNLLNVDDQINLANEFCKRHKIENKDRSLSWLVQIYKPKEWYHRNNPNVIWFDYNRLNELEDWVSEKLNREFKLVKINSSVDTKCNLVDSEEFRNKFNQLYTQKYETFKKSKSII